jgi:hypothetical protein
MQMLVDRVELDEPEPSVEAQINAARDGADAFLAGPWWPGPVTAAREPSPDLTATVLSTAAFRGHVLQMTGKWGYAHPLTPASIYPCAAPTATAPGGDWVGTDETGYASATLKARIMNLGSGEEWWAMLGDTWLTDPNDGGPMAFPSARMAREQIERRREAERG